MAANEVPLLNLFDSFWFEHAVFSSKSHAAASQTNPTPQQEDQEEDQVITKEVKEPKPAGLTTLVVRSLSDQFLESKSSFLSDSSVSPLSVLPKLQTIPSGKEVLLDFSRETSSSNTTVEIGSAPCNNKKKEISKSKTRRRKRSGSSKSLSDLEFDELKGFMDLGFVFTEEDNKDSNLVAMIPGLQRLRDVADEDQENKKKSDHSYHARPYLSEAWDVLEHQRKESQLMNWRVPSANLEKDMKHHLKFWAHTVASSVR